MKTENKRKRPIVKQSKYPTLAGNLGFLNSVYCPRCGKHICSYYDKDISDGRKPLWHKVKFCSECGLWLDLDEWQDLKSNAEDINNLFYGINGTRRRKDCPKSNEDVVFDD